MTKERKQEPYKNYCNKKSYFPCPENQNPSTKKGLFAAAKKLRLYQERETPPRYSDAF